MQSWKKRSRFCSCFVVLGAFLLSAILGCACSFWRKKTFWIFLLLNVILKPAFVLGRFVMGREKENLLLHNSQKTGPENFVFSTHCTSSGFVHACLLRHPQQLWSWAIEHWKGSTPKKAKWFQIFQIFWVLEKSISMKRINDWRPQTQADTHELYRCSWGVQWSESVEVFVAWNTEYETLFSWRRWNQFGVTYSFRLLFFSPPCQHTSMSCCISLSPIVVQTQVDPRPEPNLHKRRSAEDLCSIHTRRRTSCRRHIVAFGSVYTKRTTASKDSRAIYLRTICFHVLCELWHLSARKADWIATGCNVTPVTLGGGGQSATLCRDYSWFPLTGGFHIIRIWIVQIPG